MITIPQEILANALNAVTRASSKHSTLAAFSVVRIDASVEGTLSLSCFNGEVAARAIIAGQVSDDASLCVDAQTLKAVNDTLLGEVRLKVESKALILENGTHRTTLHILEEDIPTIGQETAAKIASMPGSTFRSLARVIPFASTDDARPGLQVMHLTFAADSVTSQSADGFTAGQVAEQVVVDSPQTLGLPIAFARMLVALVEDGDSLELRTSDAKHLIALVTNGNTMKNLMFGAVTADSKFPAEQVSQLLTDSRQSAVAHLKIHKIVLSQVIRQVAAMGTSNAFLKTSGGALKVASAETETGQARNVLDVPVTGPDTKVWLSTDFLKRVTDACKGELSLNLTDDKKPVLCEEGSFTALIMPLYVDGKDPFADEEPIALTLPTTLAIAA